MNRRGFTVLELMLVLLLISVLLGGGMLGFNADRRQLQLIASLKGAQLWADAIRFIPERERTPGQSVRHIAVEYHPTAATTPFATEYRIASTSQGFGIRFDIPFETKLRLHGEVELKAGSTVVTVWPKPWLPQLAGVEKRWLYQVEAL